jgi:hypothetical protein
MDTSRKDPLLISAKVLTIIVRIGLVIGMIAIGVGIAAVGAAAAGWIPDGVMLEGNPDLSNLPLGLVVLILLTIMLSIGLLYDFVARLAQVIDTVAKGDPFIMANALRLTRMAWLALGVQAVSIVTGVLAGWAERSMPEGTIQFESDVSLTGIVLVLVLFILARVFREGARMREELEGTV